MRGARVSIIIPVFNREKLVSRAVQSCLGQTHKNVEVVCIDDGSTDASFEILSGLARADDRVRIFQNERCKGIAGTRTPGYFGQRPSSSDSWIVMTRSKRTMLRTRFRFLTKRMPIGHFRTFCNDASKMVR